MKVSDILAQSGKAYPSLEIVPPLKGMSKQELIASIEPFMDFKPKYINVTCHRDEVEYHPAPDGSFTRHSVRRRISETAVCATIQSRFDVEVVPHIICGGATADRISDQLHDLRFMGIDNVMALRGDSITGEKRFSPEPGGYSYAEELVRAVRNDWKDAFSIGVGAYPEKHFEAPNIETDIANLKKKVDAGADYIVTQMFFDNNFFYDFVRKCREAGINVPIIPGLKPLSTARQVSLLPESFSIDIPMELSEAMSEAAADKEETYRIGTRWCIRQCKDLLAHGVPAVHFYTMGKPKNIVAVLKECF